MLGRLLNSHRIYDMVIDTVSVPAILRNLSADRLLVNVNSAHSCPTTSDTTSASLRVDDAP